MNWVHNSDRVWSADEGGHQIEVHVVDVHAPKSMIMAGFEIRHGLTGIVNASGCVFAPHDDIRPNCEVCDGSGRMRGKRCPACLGDGRDIAREGREHCEVLLAGMCARAKDPTDPRD